MNEGSLGKRILTSVMITIVALVVIVGIGIGFGKIGIPLWPFVFFLMFYLQLENMNGSKLWSTAIGGIIGIFAGMSQGIFTELTGNPIYGLAGMALVLFSIIVIFIMQATPYINNYTMLLLTMLTMFTVSANALGGLTGTEMGFIEAFIRAFCSYAVSVTLFAILTNLMANKAKKAVPSE